MTTGYELEFSPYYIIPFLVIVIIVGVIGNIFVIIIFKNNKTLQNPLSLPIANLAVVDTLQALLGILYILNLSHGQQVVGNGLCQTKAYLLVTFTSASTWTLLLISINRYIKICRPKLLHLVKKRNITFGIAFSWAWSMTIAAFPLFGWSAYGYDPRFFACTFVDTNYIYLVLLIFSTLFIPFFGISFNYFHVFCYIHNKRISMTTQTMSIHAQHRERKLSVMLGIVVISYICIYTPMTSIYIYEKASGKDVDRLFHVIAVLIFLANNANNPFIYGLMNHNFRIAFFRLLQKKLPAS